MYTRIKIFRKTLFSKNYLGFNTLRNSVTILVKVFKNGPSKICGRQPIKNSN